MKILQINSYYYSGLFYKKMYENLLEKGVLIDVYMPIAKQRPYKSFDYGKYTIIDKCFNNFDRYLFKHKQKKIFKSLIKKINLDDYKIIHAQTLFSNGYLAYKIFLRYQKPYVVTIRGTDLNFFLRNFFWLRKTALRIMKNANKVIFLSKIFKDKLIKDYIPNRMKNEIEKKSLIIPNGIDDFWFNNINQNSKEIDLKRIKIIQVGDINKNKNVIKTIEAISLLRNEGYNVELNIVGPCLEKGIMKTINRNQFINNHGYKNKEELLNLYRENDIFVMPSISETFGFTYAEAMSQGLPVLYSKGQGFDMQFSNGLIGYAVNNKSEFDIASHIIKVIENYDFLSQNTIKYVRKFQWSKIVDNYIELYRKI